MDSLKEIQLKLKQEIPFKWRVQSYSKQKPQATCVAYIDSRDVQDVLDSNCDWSDRYYEENGMLFCEITIYVGDKQYKRSDTGSESQAEAQKGHSSDAFKRAAVKFGVGRFLYSKKIQYIKASESKKQGNYPYPIDNNGKRVWDITTFLNSNKQNLLIEEILINCETLKELGKEYNLLSKEDQSLYKALATKLKAKLK